MKEEYSIPLHPICHLFGCLQRRTVTSCSRTGTSISIDKDDAEPTHNKNVPSSISDTEPLFTPTPSYTKPDKITQYERTDLIKDLDLLSRKAKLLASRLQEGNFLLTQYVCLCFGKVKKRNFRIIL